MLCTAIPDQSRTRRRTPTDAHRLTRPLDRFGLPGRVLQPVVQSLFVVEGPCLDEARVDVPNTPAESVMKTPTGHTGSATGIVPRFRPAAVRPDVFDRKRGGSGQNLDNLLIVGVGNDAARDSTGRTCPVATCSRRK